MGSNYIDLKCSSHMCLQAFNQSKKSSAGSLGQATRFGANYQTLFSTISSKYTVRQIFTKRYSFYPHFFLIIIVVGVEFFGVWDWVFRVFGHVVPSLLVFLGSGSLYVIMNIEE